MNVLNGLLAAAVAAVAYFAVIPVLNPVVQISLPPARPAVALSGEKMAPPPNLSPVDYALISNQNLFHPERKTPPEKQAEKVIPKPDLFLYGTLITNDASFAFIEDKKTPYSTAGRGKRQVTLKKGDSVSGYILSEIEANRIVLVKGEDKVVVTLDDRQKRRTSEQAFALPAAPRAMSGGASSFPSAVSPAPQAAPASAQAITSPGPGIAPSVPPQFPQTAPASGQAGPSLPGPGIGGSGTWPPTRGSIEQTQQKILDGRQMRMEQMQGKQ